MKLTKEMWFRAGKWVGLCLIAVSLACISWAQAVTTTTVQGTVYQANGTPSAGTLQLSWPGFTTANNQTVIAGRTAVPIGADGFVSVNLAPNLGSSPAGLFYTAVYHLSDSTTSTEYWVVPAAAQASLAQVRSQVMPAAQAVQAVNKAYVDQAIQLFAQTSLSPSGGTLSGPLYLSADPSQALQAADKHYVDSAFSQAVPLTGASLTGPLTSVQLGAAYQVDQFPGVDFGAKLQGCLAAVNPVYGGTCDARNFIGNLYMASNLTISTANTTIMLPCATVSTASQLIVAAGTRNVSLRGCALRGASNASGSQGGTVFLYSGTGAMVQVGDPTYAADTLGFHFDNAVVNTTPATSSTAQALAAYRTQEMDLQSLYLLGNSNQTGMTLDGTGNYSGGTFYDIAVNGFQTAVNAIGHQIPNSATTDWVNASTFVRLHIDCPTSGGNPINGTSGINLQQGDGNTFTGGDVEGCGTALHLGTNAQNNTIVGLRNENSDNQVVADAGSSYNNWITGGTMFTGKLTDNGTRNSFLDTFHRSFNGMNGDWYGSQQDATVTNHFRLGVGAGIERGFLNRYQTDFGYRWTTGLSDATAGEQFYQILDELNNVYRLSIGQYNNGQPGTNNQTVINAAGTGAVLLNGSNNSGTGGVVIGSGGPSVTTVATISNGGSAQFNGTLQVNGPSTFIASTTVRNQADAEIDSTLTAGATTPQKESFTYKDYNGASQWYMVKDASNNWALNSAIGGLDSFKAYQSSNSGDTYINASNPSGLVRVNYESGAGTGFSIYGGNSSTLYASFTGATSIKLPGLAAGSGHNCLQIDNSGYITNTGTACSTGGGSGTVNSGAAGQIAYYSGSGTAINGVSTIPVSAGGTGASSAAAALASLGGASLNLTTPQNFAGSVNSPAVITSVNLQVNVMALPYNAKGDCVTDDSGAFSAAIAAASPGELYVPKAPGGCYLVNTPTTVPAGATITFASGAVIKTPATNSWTINGMINAGRWQIFNSGDVVSFWSNASLKEVYPEWWGADPTGANASAVAWQDAVNSVQRVNGLGGVVSCPNANYLIENTVTSFAPDTASGVSLIGPDSQNNNSAGACSLKWAGPVGGTVFHYIGGHQGVIKNITFNANGIASRGLWLDSENGASASSSSITSVVRSCLAGTTCGTGQGNIVTVTTSSVPTTGGWLSGTDLTLSGITDRSFNGVFPVWYQVDTTHYVFSQGGPLASSSGGTAAVVPSGDIAGIKLDHVQIYSMASQTANITSCSVASNVETCTISAPVLQYPNEWTWTTGSSDPVYNAYWKLIGVSGPTGFTATATEVTTEAAATSGTFQGPSSGISFGSNQLSLMNNSVCCTDFDGVNSDGIGISPTPLIGYEWDGSSNVKDFALKNAITEGVRIGYAAFGTGGNFLCENCGGTAVKDALYAASVLGVVHIHDTEWEQLGTAYVMASFPSGSYNAATLGTSGQFELNNSSQGSIEMDNVHVEATTFAPDGVAISTGGTLILRGNSFGYVGDTASHVTSVVTATPGSGQTPGSYVLNGTGGGGTGSQIYVTVGGGGTVIYPPVIIVQGNGYTSAPTFTISAGGTAATFTATLGLSLPLLNVNTYFSSGTPSSLTSIGNTYYNVPAGGWVPVVDRAGGNYTAYGSGSRAGGSPVTTFGDSGTDTSGHTYRLSQGSTLTELRYVASPSGTPLDDASVGFPKMPNNTPGQAWRNAADSSDCWLVLDTSNSLDEDCGSIGSPTVNPLTTQGNSFNGNNQLVQTGGTGTVPVSVLPQATTSTLGGVKCDGTTITCTGGVITASGGATNVPKTLFAQNTNTVVNSTNSETALFTGTIPANTVGVNSHIKWTAAFMGETSAGTCTFKAYLSSSTAFGGVMAFNGGALAVGSRNQNASGDVFLGGSLTNQGSNYVWNSSTSSGSASNAQNTGTNMANFSYFIVTATPSSATTDATGCVLNDLQVTLWP